ncbi:hypothetical protein [Streptomyces sp. I6]|uniref:DUF7683 domain-containing protein n=1 Tax=Streptomyces sp. I6 TaxID=2483113 RepID=UPI000F449119|nr:hypothetical protein [Streptomyces sp. I6]RNL71515.1 hypothetical protein EBF04_11630 [Streptomyces sp. I6]
MGSAYTKRHTEESTRDAIALVDSSGRTVTAVAREPGVSFRIARYRRDEDFTDDRWDVTHLGERTLAEVFHITHPDHLGDTYRVTEEQAAKLAPLTGLTFDLETYEYYLEPTAD